MRFAERPVGRIDGRGIDRAEDGVLDVGDVVTLTTGEQLMVIAVCSVTYQFQSLNGRGKPMMTVEELDAVFADVKLGIDAVSVVG